MARRFGIVLTSLTPLTFLALSFLLGCGGRVDDVTPSASSVPTQESKAPSPSLEPPTTCQPGSAWASPNDHTCVPCPPGTYCGGGSHVAEECKQGWDDDADPLTKCAPKRTCTAGSFIADDGNSTTDRTCAACSAGTYTSEVNRTSCAPGDLCPAGTVLVAASTSTSTPPTCSTCPAGTFCTGLPGSTPVACADGSWDHDASAATACVPWSTCTAGQYVAGGTATTDRCAPCLGDTFSTTSMAASCTPRTTCSAGSYAQRVPSPIEDRTCLACPSGTNSTIANATTCGAVQAIAANGFESCALMTDESVKCWGWGHAQPNDTIPGLKARSIVMGLGHTCALTAGGDVWCWGANDGAQLGDGTTTAFGSLRKVAGLSDIVSLEAVGKATFARRSDGTTFVWGTVVDRLGLDCDSKVYDCGFYTEPDLVLTTPTVKLGSRSPVLGTENGIVADYAAGILRRADLFSGFTSQVATAPIAAIAGHCALYVGGSVSCWQHFYDAPSSIGFPNATHLASSGETTCATSGGQVFCLGSNYYGQLGAGGKGSYISYPILMPGVDAAVAVATGERHTCALRVDGSVRCWGDNIDGQLGDGTTTNRYTPVTVLGL